MRKQKGLSKIFAIGLVVTLAVVDALTCRAYFLSKTEAASSTGTPSVNFLEIANLARVSNKISVAIRTSDPSGISRVDLLCDNIPIGTVPVVAALSETVVYFAWDTTSVLNGKHILQARATNSQGEQGSTARPVLVHNFSMSPPVGNVIALNPYVKYQTMRGWEAVDQAGQLFTPAWNNYKDVLLDEAVNDLGINRIRLEIMSGSENPTDYFAQWQAGQLTEAQYNAKRYEIINDDADPNHINPGGFKWSQLDSSINNIVLPMRQRLQARGESLWVNLNYVDFGSSTFEHKNSPAEYAEFVLATYQHMQNTFGFVPDSWEIVLEPDTSSASWSSMQVALALKAAGDKLAASGYRPAFTAPSVTAADNFANYVDQIAQTPGAMPYVTEFAYHRYNDASDSILQQISDRTVLYGKKAGMLEWIGADYVTLHQDIKQGRNSSWQQYCLAGLTSWGPDSGGSYYRVDDSNVGNPIVTMGSRTKFLRQYFKFVRAGAQRIEALSGNATFDPLAFINLNGKYVVVVKSSGSGSFTVVGLPAGVYGIKYTTGSQYDVDLPDTSVLPGQALATSIPGTGVITIYAK